MELDKLKKFIEFMNENNLCELEIEEEGKRIRLKKFSKESLSEVTHIDIKSQEQKAEQEEVKKQENLIEIKSPMVGTFYRAPSPGAKPYVEVGDILNPGMVVCIIEAMKLMNEIKSEVSGRIVEILVENGEPVEFGQPLFLVEPL